jgi:hypothetical protein
MSQMHFSLKPSTGPATLLFDWHSSSLQGQRGEQAVLGVLVVVVLLVDAGTHATHRQLRARPRLQGACCSHSLSRALVQP